MPDKRASRGRIHRLEYELGFRDDPPGPSDEPGAIHYYNPPQHISRDDIVGQMGREIDQLIRQLRHA